MVNGTRKQEDRSRKPRKRPLRYFFLNDKLHKKLRINRGEDIIMAWSYPDSKRVGYTYSDVLRRHEKAFSTREVCAMIERGRTVVESAITNGNITRPQFSYALDTKKMFGYWWNEDNIMELHDYLLTIHRGRPRKDGEITNQSMPSKKELRAMIRDAPILYVKDESGEFKTVWRAETF